jgi:hypothetical protein
VATSRTHAESSEGAATAKKPRGRPFQKGKSGNPGGKKPLAPDVKKALADMMPQAVARLGQLLVSDDERVSLRAAEVVIERNLGKVPQPMEHSGKEGAAISFALHIQGAPKVGG